MRSLDHEMFGVGDGVGDWNHLDLKYSKLDGLPVTDHINYVGVDMKFLEFFFDEACRQLACVDWDPLSQLRDNIGKATDVILVTMSDDEASDHVLLTLEIGDVGDGEVDA